ncbi:hypothetical protein ACFQL8_26730 [Streptomyces goshikiensis]|uniref:hypothetical protein n=1 Tax=Streptomyces goshikiensis TaxID=1942 RepID=UPI001E45836D|nr:hypothetical protein [Streptomyces goshikiensis]
MTPKSVFIGVRLCPAEPRRTPLPGRSITSTPDLNREVIVTHLALILLAIALVVVFALLAAVAAGVLARLDGATYPATLMRAGATFAAVLTLAAVVAQTLTPVLT